MLDSDEAANVNKVLSVLFLFSLILTITCVALAIGRDSLPSSLLASSLVLGWAMIIARTWQ